MIAKLQPNRVRRTYLGGGRIDAFTGGSRSCATETDAQERVPPMPMPEDWMASTTTAFNGTLEIEGEGLGRLEDGRLVKDVVGTLPILVKLLDSDERLVIQAHPTVPCAKRLFNSPVGKTECWYFLPGTAPDACVYLGFKPGITRAAWEEAVRAGLEPTTNSRNVEKSKCRSVCRTSYVACPNPATDAQERVPPLLSFLHRIPVAAGDFVFVDGGMPHAIGGGCFMIELQEPSDLMVVAERVTPSGRRIPDAKMHGGVGWEKMFEVYEYEGLTYEEVCARYVKRAAGGSQLAATAAGAINCAPPATDAQERVPPVMQILGPELTDKFEMWRVAGGGRLALPRDRSVAVVTEGAGSVNGLAVKRGDRLVVSNERVLEAAGDVTLVVCA